MTAVAVHLAHASPGRVRLRALSPLTPEAMAALTDRAAEAAATLGPVRAVGRPATGSLILEGDAPASALLARLAEAGIVALRPAPTPPPLGQTLRLALLRADAAVSAGTEGALDLRAAAALACLGAAAFQLTQGRALAPASTLAALALGLIDGPRR